MPASELAAVPAARESSACADAKLVSLRRRRPTIHGEAVPSREFTRRISRHVLTAASTRARRFFGRCAIGLKFSGRTPSPSLGVKSAPRKSGGALSFGARQSLAYLIISRLMILSLLLLPIVATARGFFGAGGATISYESSRAANFAFFLSSTMLQKPAMNWLETLFALPLFFVETLRLLAGNGALSALLFLCCGTLIGGAIWLGIATYFSRRAPFLPLLLLLALQLGGAALLSLRVLAPPISIETPYTVFAVARGANPGGELSRLEESGVTAVALAGKESLSESELSALRKAHPRIFIANGFAAQSADGARFVAVVTAPFAASTRAAWRDLESAARDIEKRGGAMILEKSGAREYSQLPQTQLPKTALVALRDENDLKDWNARGAKNAVVAADVFGAAWTLLPRGLRDGDNVTRALHLGKAQTLFARDFAAPRGFFALWQAQRAAWNMTSRAAKIALSLSALALLCAAWLWSASGPMRREETLAGPQRAVGYLKKRRWMVRGSGALFLAAALIGSAAIAIFALNLLPALACWLVFDGLFFYGFRLWRYAP